MTRKQLKNTLEKLNYSQIYYCKLFNKNIDKRVKKCPIKALCENCLYKGALDLNEKIKNSKK